LEAAHGRATVIAALERATTFGRFTAGDVRAILAAGPTAPRPTPVGRPLGLDLPAAPVRSLDAYRFTGAHAPDAATGEPHAFA
jgi:hypothetical protein